MLATLDAPEIIIGICSPIGTDNELVKELIKRALIHFEYKSEFFKVTELMKDIQLPEYELKNSPMLDRYDSHIKYANQIRKIFGESAVLSMLCCTAIRSSRRSKNKIANSYISHTAYIFDQFKRKEEINLLRQVYGRAFISISVYSDRSRRIRRLTEMVSADMSLARPNSDNERDAKTLIERDEDERDEVHGQRLKDAFSLADLFINIDDEADAIKNIDRFFSALFGSNKVSPTRAEYGMYLAKSAALRSLDLSRQVGAAILSSGGEVVTLGCNEVPKAFGGTYWCDDPTDARDYVLGRDENERIKRAIMADVIRRLSETNLISTEKTIEEIVEFVLKETSKKGSSLREAQLMDLLEYGRIIHAEMTAITDAARMGKPLANTILYCTTFPCHICAKHIVASGIQHVSYIEPYPKSYAEHLHSDSISTQSETDSKVTFLPFIGISPFRYRELFEREKRKDENGKFVHWNTRSGKPSPNLRFTVATYLDNEIAVTKIFKNTASQLIAKGAITVSAQKAVTVRSRRKSGSPPRPAARSAGDDTAG